MWIYFQNEKVKIVKNGSHNPEYFHIHRPFAHTSPPLLTTKNIAFKSLSPTIQFPTRILCVVSVFYILIF